MVRVLFIACLTLLCFVTTAFAGETGAGWTNPSLTDRFTVGGGGMFMFMDTQARFDGGSQEGTTFDFENVLGVPEFSTTPFGYGQWRINPRNMVEIYYVDPVRKGNVALSRQIVVNDELLNAGTFVDTRLDVELLRVDYGHSFINDGRKEIGLMVGANIANVKTDFIAAGRGSSGSGNSTRVRSVSTDLTAPIPHIGVHGSFAFTPKLSLKGRGLLFWIQVSSYKVSMGEVDLVLTHNTFKNVGFTAGLHYLNFNYQNDGGSPKRFDWEYFAPSLGMVVSFE
jgi:hypothetical protein